MDYLDPKKKRAHKQRLYIGYALFAVLITISTTIMLFIANGYFIDRTTGEIIQNGLVFIDARPAQASITLNGERQRGGTDARLVIPAGEYTIGLQREGYQPWERSIQLAGGSLRRLTYARLIPSQLDTLTEVTLPATPTAVSQSIDKRWLLVSYPNNFERLTLIDTEPETPLTSELTFPNDLIEPVEGAEYRVVEWASDNVTVLLSYGLPKADQQQYVLLNRETPAAAINLTARFAVENAKIDLLDRSRDRFFVFNPTSRLLYSATLTDGVSTQAVIDRQLLAYRTFATDWVLYVATAPDGTIEARLRRGSQDIRLKVINQDDSYILRLAKLGNVPVAIVASPNENPISVYYDPEKYLAENQQAQTVPATTILRLAGLVDVTISSDSSTLMAYGSEKIASYEFEDELSYSFSLPKPIDAAQEARWMDGQHFTFSSNGLQQMVDFDGSNLYELAASMPTIGSFYSNDVREMYSFTAASTEQQPTPAKLVVTSLVAAADR